ncbi:polyketide cyclase [Pseudoclavibacter sp. RFBJ3]|uniref:SRPBCC family protein n=1 Tax=unclassified Pseudoclavibacter TaxID=2615177 RepID=UPI000CE793B7|nr:MULTISPECIES: SRPBCC family protein [unclassified Pseudoclavibacter]MBF4548649.1 SRPBCC family protein [Pseudoclavibacter sp. VKM Ac-2888]PPF34998.1 polyketide cyclase [Pseudoclavibacter sp. AY1H1]PPF86108.1 polyketide cyclase [Pseudoclavibacter sp. RFBJ5]PPF92508.1 polyketide cyclase [Pseudoclavibacter sp. RFBJ3]PPF97380.1 polyketide cyclase [Pseudoclavibacter sp. RFBH5]
MSTTSANDTAVTVGEDVPNVSVVREFEATPDRVFRAFVDPDLFTKWVGPHEVSTNIDHWNAATGGAYRWVNLKDGEEIATFYGSFHEVRENERIVQTQTFEMIPDGVLLETIVFEALEGGRTRVTSTSLLESFEMRDGLVASGMEHGVREGYEKLDALLAL